jgi:uncharacterized membrane protein
MGLIVVLPLALLASIVALVFSLVQRMMRPAVPAAPSRLAS